MAFHHIPHLNQQLTQFKIPKSSMLVVYQYNYIKLLLKQNLELVEQQVSRLFTLARFEHSPKPINSTP